MAEPIRIHRLSFYLYGIRGCVGTHALITYTKTPEILGSLVWLLNFRKAQHILICSMLCLCNHFHIISKWDRSSAWEHVSSHVGSRKVNIPKQNIVNFDTGTLEMSQEILAFYKTCALCACVWYPVISQNTILVYSIDFSIRFTRTGHSVVFSMALRFVSPFFVLLTFTEFIPKRKSYKTKLQG